VSHQVALLQSQFAALALAPVFSIRLLESAGDAKTSAPDAASTIYPTAFCCFVVGRIAAGDVLFFFAVDCAARMLWRSQSGRIVCSRANKRAALSTAAPAYFPRSTFKLWG